MNADLKYLKEMEGSWVYVYFSYRQFSASQGSAVAFTSLGSELMSGVQMQVLHRPLAEYMQFMVGHAGKNYPNFNG